MISAKLKAQITYYVLMMCFFGMVFGVIAALLMFGWTLNMRIFGP